MAEQESLNRRGGGNAMLARAADFQTGGLRYNRRLLGLGQDWLFNCGCTFNKNYRQHGNNQAGGP
jgi:hypothetical protein